MDTGTDSSHVIPSFSDSEDEASSSTTSTSTMTVMNSLRAPKLSEISRKRRVRTNPLPPKGKRRSCSRGFCDPKSVTPAQRVKEHIGEELSVSNGKLFCNACREELSLRANILKNHIKSTKHQEGKKKLESKVAREKDIALALQSHNDTTHLEGESLPMNLQVHRVKVVTAFLQAGVPLNKATCFRPILEENAYRLTDRSHLSNLIAFIIEQERNTVKEEIKKRSVSVIFDGTTRLGEALVIVLRYLDEEWKLQQRIANVKMLSKSMTSEEIARELIDTLSVTYGISSNRLAAVMRDRASVNGVALRTLKVVYPYLVDIGCFAHTINLAGDKFKIPTLIQFINAWNSLFSHSAKARLCWKETTGISMPSYCPTRWWSKWEVMKAVMVMFGDIEKFLTLHNDIAPATTRKLLEIMSNANSRSLLQLELASVVDAGESLVKATYKLEGDGPLAFHAYELVNTVMASIQTAHFPNLVALATQMSGGVIDSQKQLVAYGQACVDPGLKYLLNIFSETLKPALDVFKACRFFSPHKVREMKPDASSLDQLSVIPFLNAQTISNLKTELPSYLAKTADISPDICPLVWWKANASELPHWSSATSIVILIQPSSAASERVFSLLNNSFNDRQEASLSDYIEASLMLQFNR